LAIGRRGAVYRGLDFGCQTVNALNLQFFREMQTPEISPLPPAIAAGLPGIVHIRKGRPGSRAASPPEGLSRLAYGQPTPVALVAVPAVVGAAPTGLVGEQAAVALGEIAGVVASVPGVV
jgi:hypothetical protein